MQPQVEINVDEETGVWQTDGLPMLYIPRHFMVNVHDAVEAALGREQYRHVLHKAGDKSAYIWCKAQAERYDIDGIEVVKHYLQRLSVRGWGQFCVRELDLERKRMVIGLKNSIYVLAHEGGCAGESAHPLCYMFEGFFTGAMKYLVKDKGLDKGDYSCREIECQGMGFECCTFAIEKK